MVCPISLKYICCGKYLQKRCHHEDISKTSLSALFQKKVTSIIFRAIYDRMTSVPYSCETLLSRYIMLQVLLLLLQVLYKHLM